MKKTDTKVTDLSAEQEKAVVEARQVLASKQDVLIEIGKLQAFNNFKNYATVAEIISFKKIRESKQYKGLVYDDENGNSATVATLEELCPIFFGRSYRTLKDLEDRLDCFGHDFFESSQQIGLSTKTLRQLRKLPEEDQAIIIDSEAIDTGDREAVKELIEDLTDKHAKEKNQLKDQLDESQKLATVRNNLLQDANSRLNITTEELEQIKVQQSAAPEPSQWAKQVHEINQLSTRLAARAIELAEQLDDVSETIMASEVNEQYSGRAMEHMAAVQVHCVDQLFLAVNALSIETRQRFDFYVNQGRPMYSEAEVLALEEEIETRG